MTCMDGVFGKDSAMRGGTFLSARNAYVSQSVFVSADGDGHEGGVTRRRDRAE